MAKKTKQQSKLGKCAKKCKGKGKFRTCMKKCLKGKKRK